MSVFFTRRGKVPESAPKNCTVTITGTGSSTYAYATINGTKYTAAASGIEVLPGDIITFSVYTMGSLAAAIVIDGVTVASKNTAMARATYNWTIPDGITSIQIVLAYASATGNITVTTA